MKKLNVIKVGGKIVENDASLDALLQSFAAVGGDRILVHGGGSTATRVAASLGVESRMVQGRRVTNAEMLKVVTMVYAGLVNKGVVARLQALGVDSVGLSGADLDCIRGRRRPPVALSDGSTIDYGFVGDVTGVNAEALYEVIRSGRTPVLCPITHDGAGGLLNTNADTIASETAVAMAALPDDDGKPIYDVTLTYCFEKPGVLSDPDDEQSLLHCITKADFASYVADGTVSDGMIPKLQNAFAAIDRGVGRVVITRYDNLGGGTIIIA